MSSRKRIENKIHIMPQEKEIKDSKNPESNNRSIVSVLYSRIYKLKIERAEKEEINNESRIKRRKGAQGLTVRPLGSS